MTHTSLAPHSKQQSCHKNQHWLKHCVYKGNKCGQLDNQLFKALLENYQSTQEPLVSKSSGIWLDGFLGCPLKQSRAQLRDENAGGTPTSSTSGI